MLSHLLLLVGLSLLLYIPYIVFLLVVNAKNYTLFTHQPCLFNVTSIAEQILSTCNTNDAGMSLAVFNIIFNGLYVTMIVAIGITSVWRCVLRANYVGPDYEPA